MSDVQEVDVCTRCRDTGRVRSERCAPGCGIRHTAGCPVTIDVPCPSCELRQLGTDLAWSPGG
jgi:hypothetical protein